MKKLEFFLKKLIGYFKEERLRIVRTTAAVLFLLGLLHLAWLFDKYARNFDGEERNLGKNNNEINLEKMDQVLEKLQQKEERFNHSAAQITNDPFAAAVEEQPIEGNE